MQQVNVSFIRWKLSIKVKDFIKILRAVNVAAVISQIATLFTPKHLFSKSKINIGTSQKSLKLKFYDSVPWFVSIMVLLLYVLECVLDKIIHVFLF